MQIILKLYVNYAGLYEKLCWVFMQIMLKFYANYAAILCELC